LYTAATANIREKNRFHKSRV